MSGEIARGAAWMVLYRLLDRSVGIVSTAILTRLLIPADFGLVAMAMSIIAVIELATAFGFEVALIQKRDATREHFDTAWTLNIIIAVLGACITAAAAYPAAGFYADARLVPVMFAIAGGWIVYGFENIGTVNFRREMDFGSEFRLLAAKRAVTFTVTVAAALTFRSYWALVVGMVTGRVTGVVLSYTMQPFRPRLALVHARELFSFSGWLLASNITGVVLSRLPHFVVGRVHGAQMLGAYTVGSEIAQLAHTEIVAPINRAMFPGYARMASDPAQFRRICVDATGAILLVVLPASLAVAIFAEPIVRILLGVQWRDSAPVIQILAFAGAVSAVISNNVAAYLALGKPRFSTMILLTRLGLFVLMIVALPASGKVTQIAWAELVAALGSLLVSFPILFWTIRLRPVDYLASAWRPLTASCLAGAATHFAFGAGCGDGGLAAAMQQLAFGLPTGGALYVGMLWALWALSGRPEAAEAMIGRRVVAALSGAWASVRQRWT